MLPMIRDLFAHNSWANAEVWKFVTATPASHNDKRVLELLNHIHVVQRFFVSTVQGTPLTRDELQREMDRVELRASFRQFHESTDTFLAKMRGSHLDDHVNVPWFPNFQPKVHEALMQATMHSLHHRAQVATLLRQLGGQTTPIDYIVWAALGRPQPSWDEAASA
jgi:uncharacterized damage-inducible protein DinB